MIDRGTRRYGKYVWIIPVILFLLLTIIVPFFIALNYSLRDYNLSKPEAIGNFVGLSNYRNLLTNDSVFRYSLVLTVIIVAIVVSAEMILGLLIAVLFNQPLPFRRIVLSLFIIPTMLAPVVVGLLWRFILYPQYGILSVFLNNLGFFNEVTVLSNPRSALAVILIVDIWEWTPFLGLIFLSGIMSLPDEPFEAARIDGANDFQLFARVTLPMLRPLLVVGFVFRLIDAIKIFDIVYILTFGGPGGTTEVVNLYIYRLNFKYWNLGYGAAPAVFIVFLMFMVVTLIFLLWNVYDKRKKRSILQTQEKG